MFFYCNFFIMFFTVCLYCVITDEQLFANLFSTLILMQLK
jgi:hypothetical protein